jgi:hypothetical protein
VLLVGLAAVVVVSLPFGGAWLWKMSRKPGGGPLSAAPLPTVVAPRPKAALTDEEAYAELEMKLVLEPCDEAAFLGLLSLQHKAGRFQEELAKIEEHLEGTCASPFEVHLRRLEVLRALSSSASPSRLGDAVADWHEWAGFASTAEHHGRPEEGLMAWEQLVALMPHGYGEHLADMKERLGRPCEALLPLLASVYDPREQGESADTRATRARAHRLESLEACAPYATSGHAKIGEVAEVTINGRGPGRFIRHMEWLTTLVTRAFAERVGLELGPTKQFVHSPDGIKVASLARAEAGCDRRWASFRD